MNIKFRLDGEIHNFQSDEKMTITDNLSEFDIPRSCLQGHCSTCLAKLVSGKVDMKNNLVLTDREINEGFILTCQSYPLSDLEINFDY